MYYAVPEGATLPELFLVDFAASSYHRVHDEGAVVESCGVLSPDQTRIAYAARAASGQPWELWMAPTSGGAATRASGTMDAAATGLYIGTFQGGHLRWNSRAGWSPDSSKAVFVASKGAAEGRDLYVTDGVTVTQLTALGLVAPADTTGSGTWRAFWAPNSEKLAFSVAGSVYLYDPDLAVGPGNPEVVAEGQAYEWSADSQWFAVFDPSTNADAYTGLRVVSADGQVVKELPGVASLGSYDPIRIDFAPTGTYVAAATSSTVVIGDAAASSGTAVTIVSPPSLTQARFRWAPGAAWLAFNGIPSGGYAQLYSVDAAAPGTLYTLTPTDFTGPVDTAIEWSPDSTRIAVAGEDGTIRKTFVVLRDDSAAYDIAAPMVTSGETEGPAVWSPDGASLLFLADRETNNEFRLWLNGPSGGTPALASPPSLPDNLDIDTLAGQQFGWSPGGRKLIYGRDVEGSSYKQLFVSDDDGQNEIAVSDLVESSPTLCVR